MNEEQAELMADVIGGLFSEEEIQSFLEDEDGEEPVPEEPTNDIKSIRMKYRKR